MGLKDIKNWNVEVEKKITEIGKEYLNNNKTYWLN
tara:strand:- start:2800 stop:2904 length:105 start_codon:yes stop_codon:yes gene_type:complete